MYASRWLRTFLVKPRHVPARRWVFYLHLTLGVVLGAYFALIGITGSAIVFAPEFTHATLPPVPAHPPEETAVPLRHVQTRVGTRFPDRLVTRIHWSPEIDGRYRITLRSRTGDDIDIYAYVDRLTGEILGMEPRWIRWLRELHYNLLSGPPGLLANGIGAVALVAVSLSGLVVWWLGARRWTRGLRLNWRAGWRGLNYETHRVLGAASLVVLVVWAATGFYFSFPDQTSRAFHWSLGDEPPTAPAVSHVGPVTWPLEFESLLRRAVVLVPAGQPTSFDPPTTETGVFRIKVKVPGDPWEVGRSEVYFDQYSGEVRGVHDVRRLSPGRRLTHWMMPIHYGRFGGTVTRVLWFLLGFAPFILFVSGCLMWWNRSLVKKLRRWKARGGSGSQTVFTKASQRQDPHVASASEERQTVGNKIGEIRP